LKKILFLCLCSIQAIAQTNVPNLNFEDWVLSASTRFEDPTPITTWATPNYAMDLILGNPSTSIVQKSTDAHGGSFAALMKSRTIVGNFVGATLFTGYLNTTSPLAPIPMLGIPFTGRPVAMKGWYKYTPVGGDSAWMYIKLTKWNTTTNTREQIGYIEKRDYAAVNAYTSFDMPINYSSNAIPDSIIIVFSASAGAEQGVGQVGSSLWIDDVVLDYGANSINEETTTNAITCYPNPCTNALYIQTTLTDVEYRLSAFTGQVVLTSKKPSLSLADLPLGLYSLQVIDKQGRAIYHQTIRKQ
jgi:hypothetical protein